MDEEYSTWETGVTLLKINLWQVVVDLMMEMPNNSKRFVTISSLRLLEVLIM